MSIYVCTGMYPWNPQEGLGAHAVEVTDSYAVPNVGAGHPGLLEGKALLTTAPRMFFLNYTRNQLQKYFWEIKNYFGNQMPNRSMEI